MRRRAGTNRLPSQSLKCRQPSGSWLAFTHTKRIDSNAEAPACRWMQESNGKTRDNAAPIIGKGAAEKKHTWLMNTRTRLRLRPRNLLCRISSYRFKLSSSKARQRWLRNRKKSCSEGKKTTKVCSSTDGYEDTYRSNFPTSVSADTKGAR